MRSFKKSLLLFGWVTLFNMSCNLVGSSIELQKNPVHSPLHSESSGIDSSLHSMDDSSHSLLGSSQQKQDPVKPVPLPTSDKSAGVYTPTFVLYTNDSQPTLRCYIPNLSNCRLNCSTSRQNCTTIKKNICALACIGLATYGCYELYNLPKTQQNSKQICNNTGVLCDAYYIGCMERIQDSKGSSHYTSVNCPKEPLSVGECIQMSYDYNVKELCVIEKNPKIGKYAKKACTTEKSFYNENFFNVHVDNNGKLVISHQQEYNNTLSTSAHRPDGNNLRGLEKNKS